MLVLNDLHRHCLEMAENAPKAECPEDEEPVAFQAAIGHLVKAYEAEAARLEERIKYQMERMARIEAGRDRGDRH